MAIAINTDTPDEMARVKAAPQAAGIGPADMPAPADETDAPTTYDVRYDALSLAVHATHRESGLDQHDVLAVAEEFRQWLTRS